MESIGSRIESARVSIRVSASRLLPARDTTVTRRVGRVSALTMRKRLMLE
jgi:hypothetical protein